MNSLLPKRNPGYRVITHQPIFTGRQLRGLYFGYPGNWRIIGPDTLLLRWQLYRKLHLYWLADRLRRRAKRNGWKLAYFKNRYEVQSDE